VGWMLNPDSTASGEVVAVTAGAPELVG
jgi:hypothetical protein